MAAWDSVTKRRGMLGWGNAGALPEASGGFDGVDAQLFLGEPGQYTIENGVIPDPVTPATGSTSGPRRKMGIGH